MDDESRDTVNNLTIAGTSAARMSSRASSMGSVRSTISSARSSLSPLYEEGGDEDDTSGNSSANIHSKTQSTFDEDQSDLFFISDVSSLWHIMGRGESVYYFIDEVAHI